MYDPHRWNEYYIYDGEIIDDVKDDGFILLSETAIRNEANAFFGFSNKNNSKIENNQGSSTGGSPSNPGTSGNNSTLRMGSQGEEVKRLQNLLINKGYSCGKYGADGDFGQGTYDAVIAFQKANKLEQDGVVGSDTWAALNGIPVSENNKTINIDISNILYDINKAPSKYAISTQIKLLDLSEQWLNAATQSERVNIESKIKDIRDNTDDSVVLRLFQKAINELVGEGLVTGSILIMAGVSQYDLDKRLDNLLAARETYIAGQVKNIEINDSSNVRVYGAEGTINERITIGKSGEVVIQDSNKTLFLNFGDKQRANDFLIKRLSQGMGDVSIKSFEVPKEFFDKINAEAVLESEVSKFPGRPLRVDITKAENQFGLRSEQIKILEKEIIRGSGKVSKGVIIK
ncbi:peptidoglycan-binding protein [Clostridium sp. SHJSY1]|uniref:peptidoglycan-binding domain-containing protein n=1 Tax=Clostridium sp. SHJSY1 TaxID=2942483 RepID=UPI00287505F6|nr:peptidoglycan-binding domain-containing protein [Clostridium sp. SHJSY1]MDS0526551.1 peptidoglycan-binding protein [Clostridium sp. SHJSY1]